jgi:hypothetical protein
MESSSTIPPEQQLADGLHTVWEAREHSVEGLRLGGLSRFSVGGGFGR